MPKNNISSKRTSSASTKKNGLKKRFDLTSKKVQFFVVIAIVAVLGGGWFTYRSFAATGTLYSLNAVNDFACFPAANCAQLDDPASKNSPKVVFLAAKSNTSGAAMYSTKEYYFIANTKYTFCALAKGNANNMDFYIKPKSDNNATAFNGGKMVVNSGSYVNVCSSVTPTYSGNFGINYRVLYAGGASISSVTVSRDLPTPTAPAPPAK